MSLENATLPSPAEPTPAGNCLRCGREMVKNPADRHSPAADCGGDCRECVSWFEGREEGESLQAFNERQEREYELEYGASSGA